MFLMDWYAWPLAAILGIAIVGMGSKKALTPRNKALERYRWVSNVQLSYIRKIGWLEIATAPMFLVPAIVARDEITFIALLGTAPALALTLLNTWLCFLHREFQKAVLPIALGIIAIILAITILT